MKLVIHKIIFIIFFILTGLLLVNAQTSEGYIIFTPYYEYGGSTTYLIDNNQNTVNTWDHENGPASMPYLMPDSSIIYPSRVEYPTMNSGGVGGRIQRISWGGVVMWDYTISDSIYQHHHDICPLPNGNILILVWERKTAEQAYEMGRQVVENPLNEVWSEAILEIEPVAPNNVNIIWEWHLWDHLIQDVDSMISNYGVISNHPELQNINFGTIGGAGGPGGATGDWMHFNAIDYNGALNQIVISSKNTNEIYIIDHSTAIEEAASHSGGLYGKGGDFLYRWGNPEVYNRGTVQEKRLFEQHGVNWIEEDYPGGGDLIIFNNGYGRLDNDYSSVDQITTPIQGDGSYFISDSLAYGPVNHTWSFSGGDVFFSKFQSGAYRLSDGNTIVTVGMENRIFEVSIENEILWEYTSNENSDMIPRAMKYGLNYFTNNLGIKNINKDIFSGFRLIDNYPNPFNPVTTLSYILPKDAMVNITIYNMVGQQVKALINNQQAAGYKRVQWDATNNAGQSVSAGVYLYRIDAGWLNLTKKMVLLK